VSPQIYEQSTTVSYNLAEADTIISASAPQQQQQHAVSPQINQQSTTVSYIVAEVSAGAYHHARELAGAIFNKLGLYIVKNFIQQLPYYELPDVLLFAGLWIRPFIIIGIKSDTGFALPDTGY
jgi:hypothetical protein